MAERWDAAPAVMVGLLTQYGFNVIGALVIAVLGWLASRWVPALVRRYGKRTPHVDRTLVPLLASIVRIVVLGITAMIVLDKFGVDTKSILAVLGAFGLAIGLALKDTVSDVASGIVLLVLRPFDVGDDVDVEGTVGVVDAIDLFQVQLTSHDGVPIFLPNTKVRAGKIQNFTRAERRCVELTVPVSAHDIGKAIAALEDEITREPRVLADPAPLVKVAAIAPPSVQLLVRAWTSGADFTATKLDLMRRIKERIDADALGA